MGWMRERRVKARLRREAESREGHEEGRDYTKMKDVWKNEVKRI